MDEIKSIIAGETEGVLTEAYKDLLSPSAKPIGAMLLENIPDGCAECFPFETIDELKREYLGQNEDLIKD